MGAEKTDCAAGESRRWMADGAAPFAVGFPRGGRAARQPASRIAGESPQAPFQRRAFRRGLRSAPDGAERFVAWKGKAGAPRRRVARNGGPSGRKMLTGIGAVEVAGPAGARLAGSTVKSPPRRFQNSTRVVSLARSTWPSGRGRPGGSANSGIFSSPAGPLEVGAELVAAVRLNVAAAGPRGSDGGRGAPVPGSGGCGCRWRFEMPRRRPGPGRRPLGLGWVRACSSPSVG